MNENQRQRVATLLARKVERRIDRMTLDDLAALVAAVDDDRDRVLFVARGGDVQLLDAAIFDDFHAHAVRCRLPTFAGASGLGPAAATDGEHVADLLARLREAWRKCH